MKSDNNEQMLTRFDYQFNHAETKRVIDFIQQNPQIQEEIVSPFRCSIREERKTEIQSRKGK